MSDDPAEKNPTLWTAATKPIGRPFQKGQSGNPLGKRKGLERLVRETVGRDIVAIIKAQVAIAKGQKPEGIPNLPTIRAADMKAAAEFISDRGWGRALQVVDLNGGAEDEQVDLSKLSDDELAQYIELRRKMGAPPEVDGDGTE